MFFYGLAAGIVLAQLPKLVKKLVVGKHRKHRHHELSSPLRAGSLARLEQEFRLPTNKLKEIVRHFVNELNKGLQVPGSTIKALPSFVTRLPKGDETGTFLALDLGGTNLRVCEVVLEGHGKYRMRQKKYTISDEVPILSHVKPQILTLV